MWLRRPRSDTGSHRPAGPARSRRARAGHPCLRREGRPPVPPGTRGRAGDRSSMDDSWMPFSTPAKSGARADLDGLRLLAVEEDPLPDLEIHEEPEAAPVVGGAGVVLQRQRPEDGRVEQIAPQRPGGEHELLDHGPPAFPDPFAEGNGEPHLAA